MCDYAKRKGTVNQLIVRIMKVPKTFGDTIGVLDELTGRLPTGPGRGVPIGWLVPLGGVYVGMPEVAPLDGVYVGAPEVDGTYAGALDCVPPVEGPKSTSTVTVTEFGCVLRTAKQTMMFDGTKGAATIWQDGTGEVHDAPLMVVILAIAGSKSEAKSVLAIEINSTLPTVGPVNVI